MGYFEVNDKIGVTMATQVRDFMFPYSCMSSCFYFNCALLALSVPCQGSCTCFGHVFNKAYQYAWNGINMCWFS